MTTNPAVKAWAERRYGLTPKMATAIMTGRDGQALVGHVGTIAALAKRGIAAQRITGGRSWFLSRYGLSLLASISASPDSPAPHAKGPASPGPIRITTT